MLIDGVNKAAVDYECGRKLTEEMQTPQAGIVVYFAAEGDQLWDVAKRYKTSIADIEKYNPDCAEHLEKGQKIILLCRKHG